MSIRVTYELKYLGFSLPLYRIICLKEANYFSGLQELHVSSFWFCAIACGPQNKDFDAVSGTILTRIKFRLLRRLMLKVLLRFLTTFFLFNSTNKRSFLGILQGFAEVRVWNRNMKMGLKSSFWSEDGLEFCQRKNTLMGKQYRSRIMRNGHGNGSLNLHARTHTVTRRAGALLENYARSYPPAPIAVLSDLRLRCSLWNFY